MFVLITLTRTWGREDGGRRGVTGLEAIPRYKHYKNAVTNAIHLQMFLSVT